eukprot:2933009-Rhodomonas_salina.2
MGYLYQTLDMIQSLIALVIGVQVGPYLPTSRYAIPGTGIAYDTTSRRPLTRSSCGTQMGYGGT